MHAVAMLTFNMALLSCTLQRTFCFRIVFICICSFVRVCCLFVLYFVMRCEGENKTSLKQLYHTCSLVLGSSGACWDRTMEMVSDQNLTMLS